MCKVQVSTSEKTLFQEGKQMSIQQAYNQGVARATIILLVILSFIVVIQGLLRGLGLIGVLGPPISDADLNVVTTWAIPIGIGTIVLAIATIVANIGLFRMMIWGYWGTLGLNVLSLVLDIILKVKLTNIMPTALVIIFCLMLKNKRFPLLWGTEDKGKIGIGLAAESRD
jgi:hypothetical protein